MRKLEKALLVRSGVALGTVLAVTLVAIGATQFLQVNRLMSRFESAERVRLAVTGFLTMVSLLFLAFAGLSVWVGRLVLRYVAARDRLRVAKDMELAAGIQLGSMPQTFPPFPEQRTFDIFATMRPAKEVGGDFYDFCFAGPGRLVFLIADVSGKGVPAALFMMRAKSLLQGFVRTGVPLAEAVAKTNVRLCDGNAAGFFVTAWIAELEIRTGRVVYVNAGHNPPVRRRADEHRADFVRDEPCLFLGVFPDVSYRAHELRLAPGESLYLYTDGITEQENEARELFGESRLREILSGTCATLGKLLDAVSEGVVRFAGTAGQTDDRTQVELVWRGPPVRTFHEYAPTTEGLAQASADLDADLGEAVPFGMKMTVLTAADEIFVNIIRHSGASKWSLSIECAAFPTEIRLVFEDDGKPFDPLAFKEPDTSIAIEDRAEGGFGIFIVKKTMSPVTYARRGGRNVLVLGKTLDTSRCEAGDGLRGMV